MVKNEIKTKYFIPHRCIPVWYLDYRLLLWYNAVLCSHEGRRLLWANRSLKK